MDREIIAYVIIIVHVVLSLALCIITAGQFDQKGVKYLALIVAILSTLALVALVTTFLY